MFFKNSTKNKAPHAVTASGGGGGVWECCDGVADVACMLICKHRHVLR